MEAKLLTAWVLRVIVLVSFFFFAFMHLFDAGYAAQFVVWGYPQGWHGITAIIELIGAILIVIPTTTLFGVALLGVLLLAAIGTLLLHGSWLDAIVPFGFLIVVVALGWLRWSDRV